MFDLVQLLHSWLDKMFATKREIKRLTGKLLYASRVVAPGRLFLARMLDTDRRATILDKEVPIDQCFRLDCQWWLENIKRCNGVSILEYQHSAEISVDACTNSSSGPAVVGGFNFNNGEFFKIKVSEEQQEWHICNLELLAHLVAARIWGHLWKGHNVLGHTDNEATEKFLRSGRSKVDLRLVMGRVFWSLQQVYKFTWQTSRLSTKENILADATTRWQTKRAAFFSEANRLGYSPREIPVPVAFLDWSDV